VAARLLSNDRHRAEYEVRRILGHDPDVYVDGVLRPGVAVRPDLSWERVWHPSHAALRRHGPYLAVLVEVPHAGGLRLVGNLLGDPMQAVAIGAEVEGVFEHHSDSNPPYALLQRRPR
jgi:hypothetical protein